MSTLSDYVEIKQHGNWHKWDGLGRMRLADGMKLAILWPDGTESNEAIKIATTPASFGTFMYVDYAYVPSIVKGAKVWVHLRGLKAKLLK